MLFEGIPPEIRNEIFSLALYSYDDLFHPFPETSYYTRPGYRYRQRISTPLLETCRRVYGEKHDLPISQNEHVFWGSSSRGRLPSSDNVVEYFSRFTKEQIEAVVDVHIFSQLCWLEQDPFARVCRWKQLRLKNLKITIRHADWWHWEINAPLEIHSSWGDHLKSIKGLENLDIELETMERDKEQLETIAETMLFWRFEISKTRCLATDGKTIQHDKYSGQASFAPTDNSDHLIYYDPPTNQWARGTQGALYYEFPPQLTYVVSTLRWKMVNNREENS